MSIALISKNRDFRELQEHILKLDPSIDVQVWPRLENTSSVRMAVCWKIPPHTLERLPNLQLIQSYGAGVSDLLMDTTIPTHLPISRLVLPSLAKDMLSYVQWTLKQIEFRAHAYSQQQRSITWKPLDKIEVSSTPIGIMGLGALGSMVSQELAARGHQVFGWSLHQKEIPGVHCYGEKDLDTFLSRVQILICLLPLTPTTDGILDLKLFKKLIQPASIINVGRGQHLVEEDLLYAMDTGLISEAYLDVFSIEPLPEHHPFWNRKHLYITPHIASRTRAAEAANVIVGNYKRISSGLPPEFLVNREIGY